ncbi:MAG TPA: beta-ketoacyl synthase N-terminal-like domain-containing protein [Thermoanaerobaculia bacterium]|nr:beta-ketoacyl synthase N-terminal-like domain-containing protein [Thermoanaerobaculia bacterium]
MLENLNSDSLEQFGSDDASLASAVARDVRTRVSGYPFAAEEDPRAAERELGAFSLRWMLATLQQMGVMRKARESYDVDALKERLGIEPKYHRYFDALVRRLQAEGLITLRDGSVKTTALVRGYALTAVDEQVAEFKQSFAQRYPAAVGLMNWAATCLGRYEEILTGRTDVTEVVFPDGDMSVFAEVFGGDVVSDYFNRIVADAAHEAVVRIKDTTPKARILEIGAGTGGTTAAVLEALQPLAGSVEFCFTDISHSFLRHAKRRFDRYPWIEYRALNIEDDPARQGFEPHCYDIVIAANVLHDTRDIEHTLAQTRKLLKPGGLLIVNEFTRVKESLSFSGALLHGYWLFEDAERRLPDTCLMSVPLWSAALAQSGFAMVEAFALPTQSTDAECSQSVMLCEALAIEAAEPLPAQSTASRKAEIVGALVEQEALGLLGEERAAAYAAHRPLMDMGLDSMELVELKSLMEGHLGVKLPSKFLFEHETPEKLTAALADVVGDGQLPEGALTVTRDPLPVARDAGQRGTNNGQREAADRDAVAIVGMACRFPGGAVSPASFWQLLESGSNGIVSMPAGRWQWPSFIDLDGKHRGIDKAGFLERIDEFDAPFFRISAKEAELMDPQQRLLLELSWEAMEDAGHRPSALSGRKVGVFVGVCHNDYREVLTAAVDTSESYLGTGSAHALLANRVSFFYDFKGPSLAVDTACSSSLVALHDAVATIRRGDCEQALVGAVNLLCSPTTSVTYYDAGMLSPNGACRTFDAQADGYVRGEGGAMLLLKPLRSALADGDAIYGLVTGTAVNHGGQAASLTAPKPEAQASVIEAAWQAADVPMESVGYIEAHGTGTRLGDPIEIGGLTEAFQRLARTRGETWPGSPHCGLGSVKTQIGHLEAAAGLAGVLKILLAMQHRSIPATRNFERLNPEIDLTGSPFFVVTKNEDWPARGSHPRRAGVSSFGFGGSNSHAVVEEYPRSGDEAAATGGEYLIPLSARSDEQLTEQAKRLLAFLESAPDLADVAYTLQIGREPMEERVAFIAESREELASSLRAYVAGDRTDPNCYRGQAPRSRVTPQQPESGDLFTIASRWVKGAEIDWARLAGAGRPRRTHLPTYPFARQRYWVAESSRPRESAEASLHPLLHRNTSDLREQRFSSTFTGEEFFLANHRIGGRRVLPGVAYLEMAREAVARAAGAGEGRSITVRNIVWMRPLAVGQEPLDVHIGLDPKGNGEIGFEIYSGVPGSSEEVVHGRGVAAIGAAVEAPRLDVAALARRYEQHNYSSDACYAAFSGRGMEYSGEHRGVEGLCVEADEVVARLSLPATTAIDSFVLHPGLMDSGLHATIGFALASAGGTRRTSPLLPFELRSTEIYGPCAPKMWAVARRGAPGGGGVERYDIDLCDDAGSVRVRLSGLILRSVDGESEKPAELPAEPEQQELSVDDGVRRRLLAALAPIVSKLAKVSAQDVRPESEFGALGFDSISYVELVDQLNDDYGVDLDPTVFFEHRTLERFARHLLQTHGEALGRHFGRPNEAAPPPPSAPAERPTEKRQRRRFASATPEAPAPRPVPADAAEPIAIVGISGRFPMARDVDELWENLVAGRDCISEIPPERWDWRDVYGDPVHENKTNVKWGGFIDGVDEFDPPFFNISSHEAEMMDPQQRLLMMYVWKAIEDAGYSASRLAGSNTGIFFGAGITDYGRLITRANAGIKASMATGTVTSVGPNRMSYYLDLHGPSEPVETACSSSLVAIHRAVWAMRNGHCEMAIAGGVNTILTPDLHISFTRAGMLSADGRCKTFAAGANGYVRSEGVGALFLKKLSAAEAAGDHIYAVIVGSAENHGGRANSLTAPNPEAQAQLLEQAYLESGVDPRSVTYIEAHGTGTALGDPIEIEGLKTAFAKLYGRQGVEPAARQCGLGSVKSNIGHLEVAAGVAGVIKVLLQMRHKTLVPSLHCETVNPYIHFEGSPFYVVQKKAEWTRGQDGSGDELPRRAGVSSFGFGGVNAHIVLEEYVANREASSSSRPVAVLLSARTPERLREQAAQFLAALETGRYAEGDLTDIAYTLQVGREHMEERLGLLVSSLAELEQKLHAFLDDANGPGHYLGHARKGEKVLTILTPDEAFQGAIGKWLEQGRLEMLLELWVKGLEPDWSKLYSQARPRRISLPTYPFARERHWVAAHGHVSGHAAGQGVAVLHPLLHRNTSDLREQRFSSTFTGEEFFLAGHCIGGRRLLPAVAYLEMVREAVTRAVGDAAGPNLTIKSLVWLRPLAVEAEALDVHIGLVPKDRGEIGFEIYSGSADEEIVHARGVAALGAAVEAPQLDVEALARRYEQHNYPAEACYAAFSGRGMEYGGEHRAVEGLRVDADEVVARLSLPASASIDAFVLHPGLVDAALQATIGFALASAGGNGGTSPSVPFELRSAEIYGACAPRMWAVVRRGAPAGGGVERYDIDLCDDTGSVRTRLGGLTLRSVDGEKAKPAEAPAQPQMTAEPQESSAEGDDVHRRLLAELTHVVSKLARVQAEDVEPDSEFGELGFDSISYIELVDQLNESFGVDLDPTVFFEHRTLEKFSRHLLQTHGEAMTKHFGRPSEARVAAPPAPSAPAERPAEKRQRQRFISAPAAAAETVEPIAIVGMSGRFPMATDVEELWQNLVAGRDCISEIPPDRWDWRDVYGDPGQPNKTPVKWGGFIDGIDEFDPLFFNISPHEAELMDPQQRLLMMYVWKAIEDAGYSASRLAGSSTGIFFGTGVYDYGRVITQSNAGIGAFLSTGMVPSVGPNRMSYYLDLHGPSEPIETACSSSLVAIHRAVWAMRNGQCEMAIAGGVNTILTPDLHISFTKAGMLSGDGRCKTFSAAANGYVRGEGVGALFLKKLSAAEAAGDHIYAVIVGSAENHGGKANSLTAPNPEAQAELLRQAYLESGVDPRSVTYIEAHGTGTALGDPIEIEGLKAAFAELYGKRGVEPAARQCGLGSVKSNIGHLELAAGVAGVIKVLLQMRHKTLVPSLHCETINPYIRFEGSPFYVVQKKAEWTRRQDENGDELPRRAGVSSFGFGGANAHIVLEEYVANGREASSPARPVAVLLSARTPERLREQAAQLLATLRTGRFAEGDLADIAYTLQVGREHMEERLGLFVSSLAELQQKLQAFLDGASGPGLFQGQSRKGEKALSVLTPDVAFQGAIEKWIEQGRLEMLLDLWVKGLELDWNKLYGEARPRRVSLPTYPFARERHWIAPAAGGPVAAESTAVLHPLLHSNTSDLSEQRYSSTFTGEEFFLADHQVAANGQAGQRVLPGVAYLEMVRAAVEHASPAWPEAAVLELRNAVWLQPIVVTDRTKVSIALSADDDQIEYRIYSQSMDDEIVHCHGRAVFSHQPAPAKLDLAQIEEQMGQGRVEPDSLYATCARMGLGYGPAFRGITALRRGDGQLLAHLRLPAPVAGTAGDYVLHPSLMDSALQASVGLIDDASDQLRVPFALESLRIVSPCTGEMVAWVRCAPGNHSALKLDIDLCDDRGNVCVQLRGLALRVVSGGKGLDSASQERSQPATVPQPVQAAPVVAPAVAEVAPGDLTQKTQDWLLHEFSVVLKLEAQKIDPQAQLETYGIDSLLQMELTEQLEKTFGPLSATLFFEYQTLGDLTGYFVQVHAARLAELFPATAAVPQAAAPAQEPQPAVPAAPVAQQVAVLPPQPQPVVAAKPRAGRRANRTRQETTVQAEPEAIAIIGLSGRYPEAIDIEAYWRNLRDGKDCIIEVPKERWDWREYFSEDRTQGEGYHYSKWGGFISGVDEFDPLFFNISPKEAKVLDPQERLFLQHAWMAIEDAGYTRARLQMPVEGDLPGQVGVYAGVIYTEYQLFGVEASSQGKRFTVTGMSGSAGSIANRVSYALNLHGPSMMLDTMCSSSLTAIHVACQDLKQGRTSLAIAGGVNVSIHPNKYLALSAGQFISSDGHCQSFGEGGDGYIPGEGVGVVILKRLSDAERDGDHIYGVIRGSSINHDGKTNGYTVPNPQAQAAAIGRTLAEAHVDPRHISYIEAHGTGTKLGDPIEITALTKAFHAYTKEAGYCRIGSAKSNIGHAEAAAGVAGLTKVLLQLQHQQIVPSLHSAQLNPHIDFGATPFVVNQSLMPWEQPVIDGHKVPRIAGISSFGAGGSNAHLIVEEYQPPVQQPVAWANLAIVLSARTAEQLRQKAQDLLDFVRTREAVDLAAVAFTLQTGREGMDERLGFVVSSAGQLVAKLEAWLAGEHVDSYEGQVRRDKGAVALFGTDASLQQTVEGWIANRELAKLVELWAKGLEPDWARLYGQALPPRISLPTYPFAKERYWIDIGAAPAVSQSAATVVLHPLLHRNTSTLTQQSYSTRVTEPLSAAAYLELARAAVQDASEASRDAVVELRDVRWAHPLPAAEELSVTLLPDGDEIRYEIHSRGAAADEGKEIVHCQGRAAVIRDAIELRGPGGELLTRLRVPEIAPDYVLSPALIEDALRAAAGEQVPAAIESLRVLARCTAEMAVWVRRTAGDRLEIDLCDERGNVCAQLRGVAFDAPVVEIADTVVETPAVEVPIAETPAAVRVRREIPLATVERKKRGAIALSAPGAVVAAEGSTEKARLTLSNVAAGAPPSVPPVKLYDDGDGLFSIEIGAGGDAIASLRQALDLVQAEASAKVLELRGLERASFDYNEAVGQKLFAAIVSFPYPTVALLHGDAHGAAFTAAALCDFVVCNESATCASPEPSIPALTLFSERFGNLLAQDFLYRTTSATGRELRVKGWTCAILPSDAIEPHAEALAAELTSKSQEALRLLKQHLTRGLVDRVAALTPVEPAEPAEPAAATCEVIVLSDDLPEDALPRLRQRIAESDVPVVAALTGNARGDVWMVAQSCDACVYNRQGTYSAAGVAQEAAAAFAYRLGDEAVREILLTGGDYSGSQLEHRVAGLIVVDGDRVVATAEEVAASWARLPRTTLAAWKRHSASVIEERTSAPARIEPESPDAAPVALQSRVVTVTPHANGVVVVTMEEREARNMFSGDLIAGLNEAFAHIAVTPSYKVVVLTGYDTYFAAGGTKESLLAIQAGKVRFTDEKIFQLPLDCRLPVIAAMQGHGLGAGWTLGMFSDVALLSEESRYVSPYMNYGFTPGAGATFILADKMGQDLARESLFTAQAHTGRGLKARGVRQPVLRRADVLPAAMALAGRMAQAPRERLIALKQQLAGYVFQSLEDTYQGELAMHDRTFVGRAETAEKIRVEFAPDMVYPDMAEVAAAPALPASTIEPTAAAGGSDALRSVTAGIRTLLANELQMNESDVLEDAPFIDLGLDSIAGVSLMRKVNEKYRTSVEATKLYSYPTLMQIARYVKAQAERSGTLAVPAAPPAAAHVPRKIAASAVAGAARGARKLTSWRGGAAQRLVAAAGPSSSFSSPGRPQAVAVVGMAGQFPQARNLDEFWQNLAEGKNCITPVPADRWDLQTYYQPDAIVPGKTNCQYVGALDEYDRFDPLFFNISPTEAENMDPQQRLFLQSCWHTIEHAGYDARALSGTKCGVFVGCATGDYHDNAQAHQLSAQVFTGVATSILAARISYFLNLQGPCVAIDTACSSSLVAIAQACDSLNSGASDVALAGGVYVMAGPSMHIMTAQTGMLSPEGKCFTFDQRAGGFVPGEGVGVVMLKRLADAERDGDVIYGVIEGWGVNQDGKTNGITAPNPESQTRLEQEVYDRHGIDPSHIQLIEAHGTGTKLGDPIEVEGLRQAFKKYTERKEYCALGSVKSNIGHTLMAAGVAGVIKILLSLQNRKLPPTINFERLNEHIDLADSPFYVNTRLQEWELAGAPRRQAAVSSFAFSGTNAHLVIGEHPQPVAVNRAATDAIIPLSARTPEQLHEKAADLLAFLRGRGASVDLADVAYTLQVGRTPMEERLGFVASSVGQLAEKLEAYVHGTPEANAFHRGRVKRGGDESLSIIAQDDDVRETIVDKWVAGRKLSKLLELWVKGWELDWNRLHGASKPRRISLPVYPFAKERYWVDMAIGADKPAKSSAAGIAAAMFHPLVHRNTSDLSGQRYTSAFTGNEFFLNDHRVRTNGGPPKKVLPGAAYLEMARAALEQASPDRLGVVELRNTAWLKPVIVTEQAEISISLIPSNSGHVDYEIYSVDADHQETTHCRGQAVLGHPSAPGKIDLDRLRAEMNRGRLEAAEIYARFEKMGLRYGPAHQGVVAIDLGENQTLAELRLPESVEASRQDYVLHPGLMDSALQASIGLFAGEPRDRDKPRVPFLLNSLQVVSACTAEMFAWVRSSDGASPRTPDKVDIDLCDPHGNVCVRMRGFATRDLGSHSGASVPATVPAAKLHIKKDSSFDRDFYRKLIADVANNIVTIDDAVRLK